MYFFPSKLEILWFCNQQMYNLHFLRHGNLTFISLLYTVRGHFYCTYNLNKNSNFYQQNLQSYRHLFLYPSINFPFESELFITNAMNNYPSADVSHSCEYHTFY